VNNKGENPDFPTSPDKTTSNKPQTHFYLYTKERLMSIGVIEWE